MGVHSGNPGFVLEWMIAGDELSSELSLFCNALHLERDIYVVAFHRRSEETTFKSAASLEPTSVCTFAAAIR